MVISIDIVMDILIDQYILHFIADKLLHFSLKINNGIIKIESELKQTLIVWSLMLLSKNPDYKIEIKNINN